MGYRITYQVVLDTGDHFSGSTPVTMGKHIPRPRRANAMKEYVREICDVHKQCQLNPDQVHGHIQLGDWRFDANKITALSIVPEKRGLFGWKEVV